MLVCNADTLQLLILHDGRGAVECCSAVASSSSSSSSGKEDGTHQDRLTFVILPHLLKSSISYGIDMR